MTTCYRLMLVAVIPATICAAGVWQQTGVPEGDRIIAEKYASTEAAQRMYDGAMASAKSRYEVACNAADKERTERIAAARTTAANRLATLGVQLTAEGELGKALRVYKVAYSFDQRNAKVSMALKAAGVDLKTIPIETDAHVLSSRTAMADRVVLWNTHNGGHNTSGSLSCNVILQRNGVEVWRSDNISLIWRRGEDSATSVALPALEFTSVKIEVTKWQGYSGGLAEVEVWRGGRNIALHRPAQASESVDSRCGAMRVTDGVTSSRTYKQGYWLLPDERAGWVEVDVTRPQIGVPNSYAVFAARQWQSLAAVKCGDVVDLSSVGTWGSGRGLSTDANGSGDEFYLQGRIGDQVFRVGSKQILRVGADGILELGMHEEGARAHTDNSGFLNVSVTLQQAGSPVRDSAQGMTLAKVDGDGGRTVVSNTVAQSAVSELTQAVQSAADVSQPKVSPLGE